ncbi:carbohydrate esterase family 5 protein [Hypomontagnella monticulosa]|nr:carbohydrate esterase family 5 protein [Hypomontagnella monticulosa]
MVNLTRAALLLSASALVAAQETGAGKCRDVHVFLSRGNNEPYPGRQGKLIGAIMSTLVGLETCDYEDIVFNNALEVEYCSAVEEGRKAGIAQITAYNKRCPDTKLVISGYSQGAHVVGDILGGGGGVFFQGCKTPDSAALDPDSTPGNKIAAALLFGDTRHTANQPYNTLEGAAINGLFPRTGGQLAGINKYAGVLQDWCHGDDPICAQGDGKRTYVVQHHLNYFDLYSGAAAQWVKSKVFTPTTSTTATAASSTTSAATSSDTNTSEADSSTTVTVTGPANATSTVVSTSTSSPRPTTSSSSSTSLTSTSTLSESTGSSTSSVPTPTASQEGRGTIIQCSQNYVGVVALVSLMFMLA